MLESFILFSIIITYSIFTQDLVSAILAAISWFLVTKNRNLLNRVNLLTQELTALKQKLKQPKESIQPKETSVTNSNKTNTNRVNTTSNSSYVSPEKPLSQLEPEQEPEIVAELMATTDTSKTSATQPSNAYPLTQTKKAAFYSSVNIPKSKQPNWLRKENLPNWLVWFNKANITTKVGLLILFLGFSFLLKFSAEQGFFPIELRLIALSSISIAAVLFGMRLYKKSQYNQPSHTTTHQQYGLLLQGSGVGTLYLTSYFSFKFYNLIPIELGFAMLLVIMAVTIYLAVIQDAFWLAFVGILGGFLSPVLASTGEGSHIILFSYYLILNLTILGIAWFKSWRLLNLQGYVLTFGITLLWGIFNYIDAYYLSVQLFLIAFFFIYLLIPILFSVKQPPNLKGFVDASIVFGAPAIGFAIQSALMQPYEDGLSLSSLILGLIYLTTAMLIKRFLGKELKLIYQAFLALGTIFVSLAVPLYFENNITSAIWALEATGLIWLGWKQARNFNLVFGSLILLASIVMLLDSYSHAVERNTLFFNSVYLNGLLVSLATLVSSYFLKNAVANLSKDYVPIPIIFTVLGGLIWFATHWLEFEYQFTYPTLHFAQIVHVLITALLLFYAETRLNWQELRFFRFIWLALLTLFALISYTAQSHPFAGLGWFGWLLNVLGFYWLLYYTEKHKAHLLVAQPTLHMLGLVLFVGLIAFEAQRYSLLNFSQALAESFALFILPIMLAQHLILKQAFWPFIKQHKFYLEPLSWLLISAIYIWLMSFNLAFTGEGIANIYLPFLNVMDITAVAGFYIIYKARHLLLKERPAYYQKANWLIAIALFAFANAIILRTLYHWFNVDYALADWLNSSITQTIIAIFWSLLGVIVIQQAHKNHNREIWMAGSALLALVVLKLFLVDLSNSGSIARIISFIGVGGLLLLVGYLFPLPENKIEKNNIYQENKSQ